MTLQYEILACNHRLWLYRVQMKLAVVCAVAGFVMCLLAFRGVGSPVLALIVMIVGFGLKLQGEWLVYRVKRRARVLELQQGKVRSLHGYGP